MDLHPCPADFRSISLHKKAALENPGPAGDADKLINKSSVSVFDILVKAGHMRMVKRENAWQLHDTGTKDLALLEAMDYVSDETYPL